MYREIPSSPSFSSSLLGPEELDAGASFTVVVLRVRGLSCLMCGAFVSFDGCSRRWQLLLFLSLLSYTYTYTHTLAGCSDASLARLLARFPR